LTNKFGGLLKPYRHPETPSSPHPRKPSRLIRDSTTHHRFRIRLLGTQELRLDDGAPCLSVHPDSIKSTVSAFLVPALLVSTFLVDICVYHHDTGRGKAKRAIKMVGSSLYTIQSLRIYSEKPRWLMSNL